MSIYRIAVNGRSWEVKLISRDADGITFAINNNLYSVQAQALLAPPLQSQTSVPTKIPKVQPQRVATKQAPLQATQGEIRAPISGSVIAINVEPGSAVTPGQTLVVLEAMKMENPVKSPVAGIVKRIAISNGADVKVGQVLLEIGGVG